MAAIFSEKYSNVHCPCCDMQGTLTKYQDRIDAHGHEVEIATCMYCTSLVNITDLLSVIKTGNNTDVQKTGSEEFYQVTSEILGTIKNRVAQATPIIDFALANLPPDFRRVSFMDFGAGMGFTTAAGALQFEQAFAIEYNTVALEKLLPHFEKSENIKICTDLDQVKAGIDLVTIWHTIEHMPNAQAELKIIREKLSDNGAMLLQCPMFKADYVVYSHYFFLNEFACRAMCERAGFKDIQVWFDKEAEFITCLARKAQTRTSPAWHIPDEINPLNSEIIAARQKMEEIHTQLIEAQRDIQTSHEELEASHQHLERMLNSLSWRVTAPLRTLRRYLKL
ncbi:methyltransferase domain-containing protein [Paraburkholderia bonniea]|uniref:methyltransferase domain-containing protein n=1 Tax=Paraburkholderia bonniea TaxID=2152891 RepID=UPI00129248C2|nr:methyltransferase domain-containing protein [Paraburkholderia bonniea]